MSEKIELGADTTEANRVVDALRDKIDDTKEKLGDMAISVDKQAKLSFDNTLRMMRASYTMISGVQQALGGSMGETFSAMYGVAISMISTYQAIAAAMAASGVGTVQAILMTASLVSAITTLVSSMIGQEEFARGVSGITTALYGLESFISVFDFA